MPFDWEQIDWTNSSANISPHFVVREALLLRLWGIAHQPADDEKTEIARLANIMEKVRELFNAGIIVHSWMRPVEVNAPGTEFHGQNYNLAAGSSSTKSAHIYGKAVDFHISGYEDREGCAEARRLILPYLEEWDIRMEDIDGDWIHIDTNPVGHKRFFKP